MLPARPAVLLAPGWQDGSRTSRGVQKVGDELVNIVFDKVENVKDPGRPE